MRFLVQRAGLARQDRVSGLWSSLVVAACLLLVLWSTGGCALGRHRERHLDLSEGRLLARPPDFLTGPVSILLTNSEDFSGHLVVSSARGAWQNVWPVSGNLFQQQGRLLFVPTADDSPNRSAWAGSFRFLWDVQSNTGLVLSESLQGFAQASGAARYTASRGDPDQNLGRQQMDEQACRVLETTVTARSGTTSRWRLWQAVDLSNVPLRVVSSPDTNLFALELSNVRVETQIPDLFQPPAGFIEYKSVEGLVKALKRHQVRPPPPDVSGRRGP